MLLLPVAHGGAHHKKEKKDGGITWQFFETGRGRQRASMDGPSTILPSRSENVRIPGVPLPPPTPPVVRLRTAQPGPWSLALPSAPQAYYVARVVLCQWGWNPFVLHSVPFSFCAHATPMYCFHEESDDMKNVPPSRFRGRLCDPTSVSSCMLLGACSWKNKHRGSQSQRGGTRLQHVSMKS